MASTSINTVTTTKSKNWRQSWEFTTEQLIFKYMPTLTSTELFMGKQHDMYLYTGCHRRNGPNFGRVFLMLNYTDITQNTYVPSWTVIEIMAK